MGRASNRKRLKRKAKAEARRSTTETSWGSKNEKSFAPDHGQQRLREHIKKSMAAKEPEPPVSRSPKQAEREAEPAS